MQVSNILLALQHTNHQLIFVTHRDRLWQRYNRVISTIPVAFALVQLRNNMTGFPIDKIIDRGFNLYSFDSSDWSYDPQFDVVFVREGSKIYTFLTLALL